MWKRTGLPHSESFDIKVVWVHAEPRAFIAEAMRAAVEHWERIITGDLPDVPVFHNTLTQDDLFDNGVYERLFGYLDAIVIYSPNRSATIDGRRGTLGNAGPILYHPGH